MSWEVGLKGSCQQDPRDSNFPWIAEPEQKLKGARSEWLDGAGCTGGYGTSDVYVQRQANGAVCACYRGPDCGGDRLLLFLNLISILGFVFADFSFFLFI